jgi:hypothetical protein
LQPAVADPAGPSPLPPIDPNATALEADRTVNRGGVITLGQQVVFVAEILAGRRVSIRIEPTLLLVFDPQTRELLRTRPNPLTWDRAHRVQGARPAGPTPRPRSEPITIQRRVSASGVITVAGQPVSIGRIHAGSVVAPDGEQRTIRRVTTQPVRSIKAYRPRTTTHVS